MRYEKIRVLLIEKDKDELLKICSSVKNETDIEIVGVTCELKCLSDFINRLHVNIVLMNIRLVKDTEKVKVIKSVTEKTKAQLIILNDQIDNRLIFEAFIAGAICYIDKSYNHIPNVIRLAYQKWSLKSAYVESVIRKEFCRLRQLEIHYMKERLTQTEQKILKLIAEGYKQKQIAEILMVEINTIKKHITNILKKTGEKRSKEAARKAREWGLI
ncbi:response regulator transcription factor [Aeribacillus composti]|uniref:Response regulator transcription factor n=2 Tax=Aeribacillus composti TaxID=1868734 RepID=A0ABY9WEZ6_9BACI|nr:response regulator transcription factor [Aeribacillus composti]WNF33340.1 response regulator transcription factor [Aeribacillus composti]